MHCQLCAASLLWRQGRAGPGNTLGIRVECIDVGGDIGCQEGQSTLTAADIEHALSLERNEGRDRVGLDACLISVVHLGLDRLKRRAPGAELLRLSPRVLELGAGVGVDELTGLDLFEPVTPEEVCVRCFQQRSGNSASPEIDVAPAFLAHGILNRHVGDLHPAARHEHPVKL